MTVTATETAHLDAVIATLTVADAVPYTIQDAKRVSVLPPAYTVVMIEPRAGGTFRATATSDRRGYRVVVRAIGRTHEGAQRMREAVETALRGVVLTIDGLTTTPLVLESGQPVDDADPGWFSGELFYTYVH